jgi:hypothetical protein
MKDHIINMSKAINHIFILQLFHNVDMSVLTKS